MYISLLPSVVLDFLTVCAAQRPPHIPVLSATCLCICSRLNAALFSLKSLFLPPSLILSPWSHDGIKATASKFSLLAEGALRCSSFVCVCLLLLLVPFFGGRASARFPLVCVGLSSSHACVSVCTYLSATEGRQTRVAYRCGSALPSPRFLTDSFALSLHLSLFACTCVLFSRSCCFSLVICICSVSRRGLASPLTSSVPSLSVPVITLVYFSFS